MHILKEKVTIGQKCIQMVFFNIPVRFMTRNLICEV